MPRIQSSTLPSNPFKSEEKQAEVKLAGEVDEVEEVDEAEVVISPHRVVPPASKPSRERAGVVGNKDTDR